MKNTTESKSNVDADALISLAEAASMCRMSQAHLRRLVGDGKVKGFKIGRNWVTTMVAVEEYLATNPRPGVKPNK